MLVIASKTLDDINILGVNQKTSIFNYLYGVYVNNKETLDNDSYFYNDNNFLEIINQVKNKVLASDNYVHLPDEELELCIKIIVTYAFMNWIIF